MKRVTPILNPDKDWSASHALDESRLVPRSALTWEQNAAIPWGDHPDDDSFIIIETTEGTQPCSSGSLSAPAR